MTPPRQGGANYALLAGQELTAANDNDEHRRSPFNKSHRPSKEGHKRGKDSAHI